MSAKCCFLLLPLLFWSGECPEPATTPPASEKEIPAAPGHLPNEAQNRPPTLRLIFAGDIMSQAPQIEAAQTGPNAFDFGECFKYIRSVLEKADVAIGNLEFTMPGGPPYTGYPQFRSPDEMATAIKEAGFHIVVGANNHANDSGGDGIDHTIEASRRSGLLQTGVFRNQLERDIFYPMIFYKNGFKIALVNYTHHTNGLTTAPPRIVNRLDMNAVRRDMETAKAMRPDIIIAFLHWGEEHELYENAIQRGVARALHEWGADVVIGSHPHVVQPVKMESLQPGGKKYLTAYSLGNFISSQPFPHTDGGIALEVDVDRKNGVAQVGSVYYIPVFRYDPEIEGRRHYFIVPISCYENGREALLGMDAGFKAKMAAFAADTRARLNAFGAKERKIAFR